MMQSPAPSVNYWSVAACAEAFWAQHELPPYRRLLSATVRWLEPQPGERWLDLGCGSGQLSRALWTRSEGAVAEVLGIDLAEANAVPFADGCRTLEPPTGDRVHFLATDFATGLATLDDNSFNGVVSGLAIQYAESYCKVTAAWTTERYDHVLREVYRVLQPGGTFVFSVNVPNPSWAHVALSSMKMVLRARQPLRKLVRAVRMLSYGRWLKREARRGRFHYLPLETVVEKLTATGFAAVEHRVSYAGQAYLLRCRKG